MLDCHAANGSRFYVDLSGLPTITGNQERQCAAWLRGHVVKLHFALRRFLVLNVTFWLSHNYGREQSARSPVQRSGELST
jgi:hypothetical protein